MKFQISNFKFQISNKGQSLAELIIVMAVAVVVVGALVFATIATTRNAQFAKNQAQATKLAQEGIEKVRIGRDRNALFGSIPSSTAQSWAGTGAAGTDIWSTQIYNGCGNSPNSCYLKFASACSVAPTTCYNLNWVASQTTFPNGAEDLAPFKRVIILSDVASTYTVEKQVTVLVQWTDFAGSHESRLTTVLRKI